MKVLGIVGSPRKGGNTEILVSEALAAAERAGAEVEMMPLAGKQITGCDGCLTCGKTARCHINDDMQMFYPKMLEADGIILGTPVYFWGVSGQMKVFIDRTGPLAQAHGAVVQDGESVPSEKRMHGLRNKPGGIIVVTARAGGTSAFSQMRAFLRIHNMIECGGAIGYGGAKGDVRNDRQGLKEAGYAGRAVVRAIERLSP